MTLTNPWLEHAFPSTGDTFAKLRRHPADSYARALARCHAEVEVVEDMVAIVKRKLAQLHALESELQHERETLARPMRMASLAVELALTWEGLGWDQYHAFYMALAAKLEEVHLEDQKALAQLDELDKRLASMEKL